MTQPAPTLALTQIGQIALTVHDIPRAVAFYRDTLGMPLLFEMPNMAFFMCGGIRLLLGLPEKDQPETFSSILYYKVDDIQGAFATLRSRGANALKEPHMIARMADHDLWLAEFRDPDNNAFALMSEVKR